MEEEEIAALRERRKNADRVAFLKPGGYDTDLYGSDRSALDQSIDVNGEAEADENEDLQQPSGHRTAYNHNQTYLDDAATEGAEEDPFEGRRVARVTDRDDSYRARRLNRAITPPRADPFAQNPANGTSDPNQNESMRGYKEIMQQAIVDREYAALQAEQKEKEKEQANDRNREQDRHGKGRMEVLPDQDSSRKRRRSLWDQQEPTAPTGSVDSSLSDTIGETPALGSVESGTRRKRSRWDDVVSEENEHENDAGAVAAASWSAQTPIGGAAAQAATPLLHGAQTGEREGEGEEGGGMPSGPIHEAVDIRNIRWTDEDLDMLLPGEEDGFEIVPPPAGMEPAAVMARATPAQLAASATPLYQMPVEDRSLQAAHGALQTDGDLPELKPEDRTFFSALLTQEDEQVLTAEEIRDRRIMRLLLKVKNGTPPVRKAALRQLTDRAREFGAGPLFSQINPLLMSPSLEDQERHLLVKVIDRILYRLDDLVRPYVHKILVVIEPLLIDQDYYARVEGREIISNMAKAAGLATMIANMRPDIDQPDEYVRNTTARAFAVVASALGIPALMPFLKAVCLSKKTWYARHTGIKIVQQIAILMGCGVLPHLKGLVDIVEHGLVDEEQKVRTMTALALAALAEAATPYGIESFDAVLKPLWKGIRTQKGKVLAAFLKAIGFIIPLMDPEYANYYTKDVMLILIREFKAPEDEMKKIVLKVVQQCVSTDGVNGDYIREDILPPYFEEFWVRRMALDRRNYSALVETTVELANKVGGAEVVSRIAGGLKDENEAFRKMVMETMDKTLRTLGMADIEEALEQRLMDGLLYSFQEQVSDDSTVLLSCFGTILKELNLRAGPYLPQIANIIKWRLNNKSAKVRQQAADLVCRVTDVIHLCGNESLLTDLGVVLYEYLGEEYPEVLGSILAALTSVVNVIGMNKMRPPVKDLLPRLTPILKNRNEKVQEHCIELVGRIADRGSEHVGYREWMRICFDLLELLRANKKGIRRATVNTFGYIARAIGPQDVLATLLNNLKVQERQLRVCTTVAIAIVAETCSPFTVLPGVMNEYRTPDMNVQNGVLKSLSFLFEYIGEMGKDYVYAVVPLLEDALTDRDMVHRQTAAAVVKHLALGVFGFSMEDAITHLLNCLWPNIFETSPHVIRAVLEGIEACRVALGPTIILQYTLQGLFHPSRRVREVYWKVYNSLYIGSQEGILPALPQLPDDGRNTFTRHELGMFL